MKNSNNTIPNEQKIKKETLNSKVPEVNSEETKGNKQNNKFHDSNLESAKLTFIQKQKIKKERYLSYTEGMNKKEKINYFLYYYKGRLIIGIIILFCVIAIPLSIYKNTRPIALSYAVINNYSLDQPNAAPIKAYQEYYNIAKGYQIRSSTSFYLDLDKYNSGNLSENDMTSYEQFPTLCYNGYFDVVITDKKGMDFCLYANLMQPLSNIFTEEMLNELVKADTDIIMGIDSEHKWGYYIDISNTEFAKELHLSYDNIYICFPANKDKSHKNPRRLIKYIFGLDFEI